METTDFHGDIISHLPIEISESIARYLPLHDVVTAQRVSHKWSLIFTRPHILTPLLRGWYDDIDQHNARVARIPEGLSTTAVSCLKTEQVDAYRTGRAFSFRSGEWGPVRDLIRDVAYAEGVLAWLGESAQYLSLLHLETGREQQFYTGQEERDIFGKTNYVTLSRSLVAVTLGKSDCTIWDLDTERRHAFSIDRCRILALAIFGKTVVAQHEPDSLPGLGLIKVDFTIWNFETSSVSSCDWAICLYERTIQGFWDSQMTKSMFHHTGQAIVLFDYQVNQKVHTFSFTRVDMDGKVQHEGSLAVGVEILPHTTDQYWELFTTATTLVDGCTFIWQYTDTGWRAETSAATLECSYVVYDSIHHELILREKSLPADDNSPPQMTTNFFWNDVVYYRAPRYKDGDKSGKNKKGVMDFGKCPVLNILDFEEGVIREAQVSRMTEPTGDDKDRHKNWLSSQFLGDGRFIINFTYYEYRVWGFEKHTPLAGEDMTYKKARELAES